MPDPRSLANSKPSSSIKPRKKSFRELFDREELVHYGLAAITYIVLGLIIKDVVLNWVIGPLFIVAWMWWVPPLLEKWRAR